MTSRAAQRQLTPSPAFFFVNHSQDNLAAPHRNLQAHTHKDLFWAYEPWKTIYVLQRLIATLLLVPIWIAYYGILPRSRRPRASWSLRQIIIVKFTKRISRVTEIAGVTWGTRDPTTAPDESALRETRFAWVPPLPCELRTGFVDDPEVHCRKVGTFIWPKESQCPPLVRKNLNTTEKRPNWHEIIDIASSLSGEDSIPPSCDSSPTSPDLHLKTEFSKDIEAEAADGVAPRMIGIFLHGGGYCHMSAHEKSGTSRIPRRLMKDKLFQEIHAVEYRLLQHAPIPGAVQDGASVYAHLVINHLGAKKGPDGKYRYPNVAVPYHTHTTNSPMNLVSPTSPGNRNGRPGVMREPSTLYDPSLNGCITPPVDPEKNVTLTGNDVTLVSKPNYTNDVHTRRPTPKRPKIVLIGDSAGGNLVLALARWIRDEGILPPPDGLLLLSPSCDPSHTLPQVPASRRPRPHAETDYLLDTPEPRAMLQRAFLGTHPIEIVYSPYISPASEWVLSVFHGAAALSELEPPSRVGTAGDGRAYQECTPDPAAEQPPPARTPSSNPFVCVPQGMGLFTEFPRALVVLGGAERLEREVVALTRGMQRDDVRGRVAWARDAVHDVLMMAWWDRRVCEGIWEEIATWMREVEAEA